MTRVVLSLVALGGVVAGFSGQPKGWAAVALGLLALGGHAYAQHIRRTGTGSGGGLRVYSFGFAAALVVAAVALWVLAVSGGPDHRGAYTGLAILWTLLASGAVLLLWGVERRLSASRQGSEEENPTHNG